MTEIGVFYECNLHLEKLINVSSTATLIILMTNVISLGVYTTL